MQTFDIIILVLLAVMIVYGLVRGLLRQIGDLAALALGVIGANIWGGMFTSWIHTHTEWSPIACRMLAYAGIFLAIYIVVRLIAHFIKSLAQLVRLGWIDAISGGFFAAFKTILLLSILLNIAIIASPKQELWQSPELTQSVSYETVKNFAPQILDILNSYGFEKPTP